MSSLVQNILALEYEASAVVAQAHEQAASIAQEAGEKVSAQRKALQDETERRIEEFRASAAARFESEKAAVAEAHGAALAAIDRIPEARIQRQVDRIVNEFRGL
jgi:hypothetical protein